METNGFATIFEFVTIASSLLPTLLTTSTVEHYKLVAVATLVPSSSSFNSATVLAIGVEGEILPLTTTCLCT